jgi:hypothetical protein
MFRHSATKSIYRVIIICCLLIGNYAYAQTSQSSTPRIWGEPNGLSGFDCETTMMLLDFVAIADRESGKDQSIIVIARLGSGERSRSLIRRRLVPLAEYLTRRVSKDKIILAEGERVRGLGQIELYVRGNLHTVIKVKRNSNLVKGCFQI